MHSAAPMKWSVLVVALGACASVNEQPDAPVTAPEPVEVTGRIIDACGPEPLPREPVAIRVAGELEVLSSTETDASGSFTFKVTPPGDVVQPMFIEARGVRAVAKPARSLLFCAVVHRPVRSLSCAKK